MCVCAFRHKARTLLSVVLQFFFSATRRQQGADCWRGVGEPGANDKAEYCRVKLQTNHETSCGGERAPGEHK